MPPVRWVQVAYPRARVRRIRRVRHPTSRLAPSKPRSNPPSFAGQHGRAATLSPDSLPSLLPSAGAAAPLGARRATPRSQRPQVVASVPRPAPQARQDQRSATTGRTAIPFSWRACTAPPRAVSCHSHPGHRPRTPQTGHRRSANHQARLASSPVPNTARRPSEPARAALASGHAHRWARLQAPTAPSARDPGR